MKINLAMIECCPMKKIIIIGAGFAGLSAAKKLCHTRNKLEITLIDKRLTSDFLPMLPDIIGRDIRPEALSFSIKDFCQALGITFINEKVTSLDLESKRVLTDRNQYEYDYLVIASGSQTTFYGKQELKAHAYTLDSVEDAKNLCAKLERDNTNTYVVCGGGYTGIEVATSLRRHLNKRSKKEISLL